MALFCDWSLVGRLLFGMSSRNGGGIGLLSNAADSRHRIFRNDDSSVTVLGVGMELYTDSLFHPASIPVSITGYSLDSTPAW